LLFQWLQELKANAPDTPFILVGTKTDVRTQKETEDKAVEVITTKKVTNISFLEEPRKRFRKSEEQLL